VSLKSGLLLVSLLAGCSYQSQLDYGEVCVSGQEGGGETRVVVEANSADCSVDHVGSTYECSVTVDGSEILVHTLFRDGRDRKSACTGPHEVVCEADATEGTYTVEFAGEQTTLQIPDGETICLPREARANADSGRSAYSASK
jgi:hypothetical protein